MIRRIMIAVSALMTAWLGLLVSPQVAADAASHLQLTYSYDGHQHSDPTLDATSERGPPAAYGFLIPQGAVDPGSHGVSTRPSGPTTRPSHDYDVTVAVTQDVNVGRTPVAHVEAVDGAPSAPQGAHAAANAGPRALPVGPWGQKIVDARGRLPSSWGPGRPNAKGVGTRWSDPASQGNGIRVDQGIPGSSFASQQVDHVVVRSGGRILGPDGKPIVGSLSQNPQAHIPYSDWLGWSSWSTP